jgi:hypothetical protein
MATEFARMEQLLGTTADWAAASGFVLGSGEIGLELRVDGITVGKVGDGSSIYSALLYTIGGGVDLTTDQIISGVKTFQDTILIENQTTPGRTGQLWSKDGDVSGQHSLFLDSLEIESNAFLVGRSDAGVANALLAAADGNMYWRGLLIADATGTAGDDWGRFDATGLAVAGFNYVVAKLAVGQYELVFNRSAEVAAEQAVTATIEGGSGALATATILVIDAVTVHIFTTDGVSAADQAVSFARHYQPEISATAGEYSNP